MTRFDNRDAGLSTHLAQGPEEPRLAQAAHIRRAPPRPTGSRTGHDAVAVLDALGWDSAHIAGTSLADMIAQTMAIRHPSRVRTLTSIMSAPRPGFNFPNSDPLLLAARHLFHPLPR